MYLAGVSVRRVEDITEALWGTRVSPSTVSDLNKKIYGTIEAWRNRPIEANIPTQGDPRRRGHCGGSAEGCPSDRKAARPAPDQSGRHC